MARLDTPHSATPDRGAQYLTFRLGGEEYAIDILKVQEIKGHSAITPIPNASHEIKGVINLRGTVVPIMGLRERFGMPPLEQGRFDVIVVVNVGMKVAGIVVDAVTDVLALDPTDISRPPELGAGTDTSFITGVARTTEHLVVVLDVEKALASAINPSTGT